MSTSLKITTNWSTSLWLLTICNERKYFFTKPCFLLSSWKTRNSMMLQRSDVFFNRKAVYTGDHAFIPTKKYIFRTIHTSLRLSPLELSPVEYTFHRLQNMLIGNSNMGGTFFESFKVSLKNGFAFIYQIWHF